MANLPEADEWITGIRQIETTDPVVGGAPNGATGAGMVNIPHQELAKRTTWLKARVDALVLAVVAATTTVVGIVKLNSSTSSTSVTEAATPSAVKAAYDLANGRVATSRQILAAGLATGGGSFAADRTITVSDATQLEAEDGTLTTKAMSPLRVHQAIAAKLAALLGVTVQAYSAILAAISGLATNGLIAKTAAGTAVTRSIVAGTGVAVTNGDAVAGNPSIGLSIATQAEAEAGAINTKPMTPLGVAQAIAAKILSGVLQAGSAILDAISALATSGLVVRTGPGTVAARSITGSGGITVANGSGVAGNPAISLNGQVAALDTLATNGMIVRTAADVVAARSIAVGAGLSITNPDAVAGNPTISLVEATQVEAEAGTLSGRVMTPLRVAQAIADKIGTTVQAFSTLLGAISALATNGLIVKTAAGTAVTRSIVAGTGVVVTNGDAVAGNPSIALSFATAAEAQAGTVSTKPMSPLGVALAMVEKNPGSYGTVGWMKLPGGMIMQWGRYSLGTAGGAAVAVTMPIAFPNYHLAGWVGVDNAASEQLGIIAPTVTGMTVQKGVNDTSSRSGTWFAIGY